MKQAGSERQSDGSGSSKVKGVFDRRQTTNDRQTDDRITTVLVN